MQTLKKEDSTVSNVIPFPTPSTELINLSDISDTNICYLASLGKYGKPVFVSINRRCNSFILHGSSNIIGLVNKKHYYLAKEILESRYQYYDNEIKRISPLSNLKGNVTEMYLKQLVSFMGGTDKIILFEKKVVDLNQFKNKN